MLKNILHSPMSFFDTTPLGRILNRFSKDIYTIDEVIPRTLRAFISTFLSVISTVIVILIATPIFAIVIIPLGVFYMLVQVGSHVHVCAICDIQLSAVSVCSPKKAGRKRFTTIDQACEYLGCSQALTPDCIHCSTKSSK